MQQFRQVKKIGVVIGLILMGLILGACGEGEGANADGRTTISIYSTGSQNVEAYWETVIPMFEETQDEIEVNLVFIPSGTGGQSTMDRLIAAKQSNNDSGIDIYEGTLSDIIRSENEGGLFYQLDEEGIPNLSNIDESNLTGANNMAVPYRASSVVLAYNEDAVADVPDTAEELYQWIKDNPGRFAYNDPSTGGAGSSFVLTAVYNQLPDEAMNIQDESIMDDWAPGFALLRDLASSLYNDGIYPQKNQGTLDLLASSEVDMIPAWSDMALEQINTNMLPSSTKLKQINPAFTGGPSYLMIADNGVDERKQASEAFLDFVLTVEAQEVVIDQMYGYPGIRWDLLSEEDQERFSDVSDGYRIFNGGELSEELVKRWQREVAAQ
ncbi:putative spermidine/putrescine transport system substrate-binding protein [Amphibacillus marinus]|uniref:Putative spermidine/putrescine transport system substrate-binding protein n=1 Tax=Amphibacillus marinus TaxID=872970 RepID=A0A1H8JUD5_9BACI|nr:extracellular solute-binding protein [Amphibacillus marinus]SEN84319.1 putative spermidine/putrescine transport system substrate-binding protein [Amphibacillus marinus]